MGDAPLSSCITRLDFENQIHHDVKDVIWKEREEIIRNCHPATLIFEQFSRKFFDNFSIFTYGF